MLTTRGAQAPARGVVLVVHTYRYGLLVRLASRSLNDRAWQRLPSRDTSGSTSPVGARDSLPIVGLGQA